MKTMLVSVLVALGSIAGTPALARDVQSGSPDYKNSAANEGVFDRNKGAIYAVYARALRGQPDLGGKVVFEVDIDAAGVASACRVRSSTIKAPDFERQVCERIEQFRFAPQKPTTFAKEVEFFAATRPRAKSS